MKMAMLHATVLVLMGSVGVILLVVFMAPVR